MGDGNGACPEPGGEREPTLAELAAIEAEWPLIEVELALLDAEIAEVSAGPWGAACEDQRSGKSR